MMMMMKMMYYAASTYNNRHDFASSSDFVVKTHDRNPILISFRSRSKWDHREKMSRESCVWN